MKQIICITGGASGLGRELAAFFSAENQVIILDIDPTVKTIAHHLGCDFYHCDVSDFSDLAQTIKNIHKKYKKINVFINNAGIYIDGPIETNQPDRIKKVFEVNCLAPIFSANILIPIFKKQKYGTIININSTAGLHPKANNSVYHASKWALTGFTESLQLELANSHIKIIDIHPGVMNTKFTQGTNTDLSRSLNPDQVVKAIDFVLDCDDDIFVPQLTIKHI
ncbi:MAG: SDR family oxidoreductase [Candidatus Shapirobacteria bacterium]|nr:SDR family oxidoreductase [Candidatus Shapirobacteria bacterium]